MSDNIKPLNINPKSRVLRKFLELYADLDVSFNEEGAFTSEDTRKTFCIFLSGWQSHPQFGIGPVSIIGEVTETGVKFSGEPRLHTSQTRAFNEKERLERKFKKSFMVFTCRDEGNLLTPKATKVYQELMEVVKPRKAEAEASKKFNSLKERFFKLDEAVRAALLATLLPDLHPPGCRANEVRYLKKLRHERRLVQLVAQLENTEVVLETL